MAAIDGDVAEMDDRCESTKAELLLERIFTQNQVIDDSGREYQLHSSISRREGQFLKSLAERINARRIVEIGCAYGISTLFLSDALVDYEDALLLVIDPYQSTYWKGIGITALEKVGCTAYQLIEEPSEYVLPRMVAQGELFDMAFVDGAHDFEHVMIDFLMLNRLIRLGGVIVFHDANLPAVRQVLQASLSVLPYELLAYTEVAGGSWARKVIRLMGAAAIESIRIISGDRPMLAPASLIMDKPRTVAIQRHEREYSEEEIAGILQVAAFDEQQLGRARIEISQKFGICEEKLGGKPEV